MGRTKTPFIDKNHATVYRLVHPDDDEEAGTDAAEQEKGVARVGRLVMVAGATAYFQEDEEEENYPYREDSGDEGEEEGEEGEGKPVVEDEYEEEEEDADRGAGFVDDLGDDFAGFDEAIKKAEKKAKAAGGEIEEEEEEEGEEVVDNEGEGARQYQWKRTDDDAQSEYSSWSKMSASSYLPPARRKQLWRDLDEFGLPDDGYDYTQHMRNPGAGTKMAAVFPHDLLLNLEKKEARSRAADHKDAKEVLHQLDEADSDDEAPPLEEGDEETENITQSRKLVDEGRVVEEGDLPDDLMDQLGAGEEEEGGYDQILHQERDQRLVDQRFDVFLSQYDDDKIGELTEEVGPTHGGEKDEQYYYDLLKQYIKTGDAEGKEILQAGGADVEENEDGEWVRRAHWKDEPRGYADIGEEPTEAEREDLNKKIRSLALKEAEEHSGEESTEEVEVDEKEQWDCESILSTYSNIYNHPKLINDNRQGVRIKLHPRTGVPMAATLPTKADLLAAHVRREKAGEAQIDEEDSEEDVDYKSEIQSVVSCITDMGARQRGETPEIRKERKELAKQQKALQRDKKKDKKAGDMVGAALKHVPSAADPRARAGISLVRY